ncbi:MAG: M64 family metallopeptidase [Saprospiraceae bacterium]
MNKLLTTLFFVSLFFTVNAQTYPVTAIINNGPDAKRVNYVVLGDGYKSNELTTYISDVTNISNSLFNASPFKEYKNFFNVYAIEVPSNESGADHPATASDVVEPIFPAASVDNAFGSTFDAFNIHRLLVPMDNQAIISVLSNNFPSYDQVMVMVNSSHYGGSGGWLATSSTAASASEIAIHELGHSFAGLADEYWAGDVYAAEKPNMTATSDPNAVKWKDWVGTNSVGVFPHGASGNQANWHRPHQNCKMRYLGVDYCSVCSEAIIDKIYSLVTPIEASLPLNSNVIYNGSPLDFGLTLVYPSPNTLTIEWELNGTVIGSSEQLTISESQLTLSNNTLVARVTDNTTMSKSYAPANGYVFTKSWNIQNPTLTNVGEVIASDEITKFYYKAFPNPVQDNLTVQYFYNGKTTDANLSILSVDGKLLKEKMVNLVNGDNNFQVEMSEFSEGIYIININNELLKASFQVVKN